MASYRRFVAYVYRYRNDQKGDNCGFVKVEARNGLCTFFLRMQGIDIPGIVQIFVFVRKETGADFLLLGQAEVKNGVLHHRVDSDRLHMGGSGYTLEQCGGIVIAGDDTLYYGTVWDDSDAMPAWKKGLIDSETKPGTELESKSSDETMQADEAQSAIRLERTDESKSVVQMESVDRNETIIRTESRNKTEPVIQTESQNKTESMIQSETVEKKESVIQMESMDRTEPAIQTASPKLEKSEQKPDKTESEKESQQKRNTSSGTEKEHSPELEAQERKKQPPFRELWEHMQKEYMRLEPFEDGGVVEGIKIAPSDIPYLQERNWNLGNNKFLLHGYKNYRHLLLGRLEGQNCYVLGVPGIYDQQEQFMAKMFGFPKFKPVRECKRRMGQFGYWLRCIS